jgi:hypothetical protein
MAGGTDVHLNGALDCRPRLDHVAAGALEPGVVIFGMNSFFQFTFPLGELSSYIIYIKNGGHSRGFLKF